MQIIFRHGVEKTSFPRDRLWFTSCKLLIFIKEVYDLSRVQALYRPLFPIGPCTFTETKDLQMAHVSDHGFKNPYYVKEKSYIWTLKDIELLNLNIFVNSFLWALFDPLVLFHKTNTFSTSIPDMMRSEYLNRVLNGVSNHSSSKYWRTMMRNLRAFSYKTLVTDFPQILVCLSVDTQIDSYWRMRLCLHLPVNRFHFRFSV